ncbi:MAG: hypothetical protein ACREP9_20315, partial [Candidatus Dormibacteraceae bacterium]
SVRVAIATMRGDLPLRCDRQLASRQLRIDFAGAALRCASSLDGAGDRRRCMPYRATIPGHAG